MKKLAPLALLLMFFLGAYLLFKKEPWPEKYLFIFDKNEPLFEMPEFKKNCNILDFGAIKDGKTKNTAAFQKAIAACTEEGGGNVIVPRGKWLTGAIHLQSNINLKLEKGSEIVFSTNPDDYLPVVQTRFEGIELYNYSPFIYANGAENISITGRGKLTGQGDAWSDWSDDQEDAFSNLYNLAKERTMPTERVFGTKKDALRPSFVQFFNCKNVFLSDFSIQDGPMWTIHAVFSENIMAENLKISSFSHNSDGFVIDSSKNVSLNRLEISSEDDAISIKSGLEPDIWNRNISSENITIRNSVINAGHAGVAIGSEMSGGVRNVSIERNYFSHLDWAVRIKSIRGRGGFVENIFAKNLRLQDVDQVLAIDLQYPAPTLIPLTNEPPRVENISLQNVSGKDIKEVFYLRGLPESTLKNVRIANIALKTKGLSEIIDSENITLEHLKINNFKDKELFIENSRDIIFRNSSFCQTNSHNCIVIDGKDNDRIHFKQTNISRANIDLGENVSKESITISK